MSGLQANRPSGVSKTNLTAVPSVPPTDSARALPAPNLIKKRKQTVVISRLKDSKKEI